MSIGLSSLASLPACGGHNSFTSLPCQSQGPQLPVCWCTWSTCWTEASSPHIWSGWCWAPARCRGGCRWWWRLGCGTSFYVSGSSKCWSRLVETKERGCGSGVCSLLIPPCSSLRRLAHPQTRGSSPEESNKGTKHTQKDNWSEHINHDCLTA